MSVDFWSDSDELNPWRSSALVAEYELSGDLDLASELELYALRRTASGGIGPESQSSDFDHAARRAARPYVERMMLSAPPSDDAYRYAFCEVSAAPAGEPVRYRMQAFSGRGTGNTVVLVPVSVGPVSR